MPVSQVYITRTHVGFDLKSEVLLMLVEGLQEVAVLDIKGVCTCHPDCYQTNKYSRHH